MKPHPRSSGFSLPEMLIALAVIAIAFGALALVQVANFRASSRSTLATNVKAAANRVLEQRMAEVLAVDTYPSTDPHGCDAGHADESSGTEYKCYRFVDYYWSCPAPKPSDADSEAGRTIRTETCTAVDQPYTGDASIDVSWSIAGGSGVLGEGLLTVTVTATHAQGASITLGDAVTCYDVYPSPSVTAPKPCPEPNHGR